VQYYALFLAAKMTIRRLKNGVYYAQVKDIRMFGVDRLQLIKKMAETVWGAKWA
jgi:hypothetical protein